MEMFHAADDVVRPLRGSTVYRQVDDPLAEALARRDALAGLGLRALIVVGQTGRWSW